jgi:predicted Zn-dependent protease
MKLRSLAFMIAVAVVAATVDARPFVPESDAAVLERLPEAADASLAELKRLRSASAQSPRDLALATTVARRSIEASRETGDPRYLGYAQAALATWWSAPDAPLAALVLRATIKQSRHDFDGALADLDRVLAARPADAQALVTRASVLTVQGRYAEAERDCAKLAHRAPELVVVACAAAPMSLSGRAQAAQRDLAAALASASNADAGIRAWALTTAAEIAARRGDRATAEAGFRSVLAVDPRDAYARAAYADLLLDAGRAREAAALVASETRHDALLLRLVLAEAQLPNAAPEYTRHRAELDARFYAARLRGDALHAREESRFRLLVDRDAKSALELARSNWQVQREPADLRVLVDAAIAADNRAALATAIEWMKATRLEDATLAARLGRR